MYRWCLLFCCLCGLWFSGKAQQRVDTLSSRMEGYIVGDEDGKPLEGAHVFMGSKRVLRAISDSLGHFEVEKLSEGEQMLYISYTGCRPWSQKVRIKNKKTDLGVVRMLPVVLEDVVVSARPPLSVQKGDTLQFNAAALHVAEDADLENLLKKLPGFQIIDGKIMAHGQEVQKIYIDGIEYSINDPSAALKNLPAKLIARIKMFDDRSEEAKFSGYDDGSKVRTLRLETFDPNKMKVFGFGNAGYGLPDIEKAIYDADVSVNMFDRKQRITLSADLRQTTLTDLADARYPGEGNKNKSASVYTNYSSNINDSLQVSGNYRFMKNVSNSGSLSRQEYLPTEDYESRVYDRENHSGSDQQNHSMSLSLDYRFTKKDRIRFTPDFSLSKNDRHGISWENSIENGDTLNNTEVRQKGWNDITGMGGNLSWMHAFKKKGRTFTLQGQGRYSKTTSGEFQNIREKVAEQRDTFRYQQNSNERKDYSLSGGIIYSEPLSGNSRLGLNYNVAFSSDESAKNSMSYRDAGFQEVIGIDTALTNKLVNQRMNHSLGVNYNYHKDKISVTGGGSIVRVRMDNHYQFLSQTDSVVTSRYLDFFSRAELGYNLRKGQHLSITYRGNTSSPSATQLQNVLDVSNPLRVSKGNPGLKRSYSHSGSLSYTVSKPEKSKVVWLTVSLGQVFNQIASNVKFVSADTVINGYLLSKGGTLTSPVNLNGMWQADGRGSYSFPIKKFRFDLGMNYSYSNRPSIYDDRKNMTQMHQAGFDFSFFPDFSDKLDAQCRNSISYSYSENSSTGKAHNLNESVSVFMRWEFWKGFLVGGNYFYTYYWNQTGTITRQSNNMLNFEIGKKFGKKKQATLSFQVNDIFRERDQVRYTVTDLYNQMSSSTTAKDYFMLSFSYRFNYLGQ